jgi:hypothetical protein
MMKDASRELLLDQNFSWTSMRRWQGIEDSQCVHMHGHGQQKQHQPDLLQPFAQTQYAWIHPQCRKQYWSCTMGSAIAQWARVWHFYSLLTTQFAGTPIVGKKSLSYTTTLRELCILSTKIRMHWNFIIWLLQHQSGWLISVHCMMNKMQGQWCEQVHTQWSTRVVMCWMPCMEFESNILNDWKGFISPCMLQRLLQHLLQIFLVFCQTITNDTK